jgi:hypothetical protein
MGFLDFLGAALSKGEQTYDRLGQQRFAREQAEAELADRKRQQDRMFQLEEAQATRAQEAQDFQRGMAQRESIEGGQNVDPGVYEFLKKQGLASGMTNTAPWALPQNAADGGADIMPVIEKLRSQKERAGEEELGYAQQERQNKTAFQQWMEANPTADYDARARKAVSLGQQAPGKTMADEKVLQDREHANRMAEIRTMYPPDRFADKSAQLDPRSQSWLAQKQSMFNSLLKTQQESILDMPQEEQLGALQAISAQAEQLTTEQMGPFPGMNLAGQPDATQRLIADIPQVIQEFGGVVENAINDAMVNQTQLLKQGVDVKRYITELRKHQQRPGRMR